MNPWLETLCVVAVAVSGVYLGIRASRLPNPWWAWMLALPIAMLAILIAATATSLLDRTGPLLFITAGRAKYVILSFAISFGLTTPMSRLPYRIERALVCVLIFAFVTLFSVLPFLMPALIQDSLANIETRIAEDGVCYQSKSYTCGPAAAVTALGKMGVTAYEGEMAILARTNPVTGTLLWTLYGAIKHRYEDLGVDCRFRTFDSVAQLADAGITLVSIREAVLLDHCVAVLGVSDAHVTIADPATGLEEMSHSQFENVWRFSGITLQMQRSGGDLLGLSEGIAEKKATF